MSSLPSFLKIKNYNNIKLVLKIFSYDFKLNKQNIWNTLFKELT